MPRPGILDASGPTAIHFSAPHRQVSSLPPARPETPHRLPRGEHYLVHLLNPLDGPAVVDDDVENHEVSKRGRHGQAWLANTQRAREHLAHVRSVGRESGKGLSRSGRLDEMWPVTA